MTLAEKIRQACMLMHERKSFQMTLHRDEWMQIHDVLCTPPEGGAIPARRESIRTKVRKCFSNRPYACVESEVFNFQIGEEVEIMVTSSQPQEEQS